MKSRKILLIIHELTYTGSPASTLRLAKALIELEYDVETWSFKEGKYISEYNSAGINVQIVPEEQFRTRRILHKIEKFDLVICNTLFTRRAVEAAENLVPTIWYIREAENIPEFFMNDFRKYYALKRAKNIWSVSEYAKEYICRYFNTRVRVIQNCIEDERLLADQSILKKADGNVRFFMSGTIERRKGFDIFLKAYDMLDPDYQEKCELHIAGKQFDLQPQYFEQLMNYTQKYLKNIFYHGEIGDRGKLLSLMNQCDVVAVISRDESCSLVALEGCMLGKPLLLSENVGAKYLLDYQNGWLVETGNSRKLKNVLEKIIKQSDALEKMGKISRIRYEEIATFEKYKQTIEKNIEYYFCKNRYLYRIENCVNRFIWWIDDLERVKVPDWGDGEEEKHLFSFDIFDTLITRKTATPSGIFSIMQVKICNEIEFIDIPQYIKDNFCLLRQHAENLARKSFCKTGCEDKTFDQIYKALDCMGLLTAEQLEQLKQLELEVEYYNTVGIDENIDRVRKLIEEGKDVVLISDMYLSSEQIRVLLCKVDSVFENIDIYVSSECKRCKGTTNLFKYVQCERKVKFSNWTHIGDNEYADGRAPKRLGITTEIYRGSMLKKSEKAVINGKLRDLQAQLTIGHARVIRVKNQLEGAKSIGASVGGIMLMPYVEWVLQDAIRRGVKILYFIARDGYVLKKIADIIILHEKYQVETKYIYGSRKAWRMPSYKKEDTLEIFFKMAHIAQLKTMGDLAKIFFLPEDILKKYLPDTYKQQNEISLRDINNIRNILEMREDFKEFMEKESKKKRKDVIGYLQQEIQFENNNFAFVELSGSGATQECLVNICGEFYDREIITYFLNLDDIKHGKKCKFINYLPNNNRMSFIIENLCRAPHGQTVSYEFIDGEYVPVLEDYETRALIEHGYLDYIEGVCLFVKTYCEEQFSCDFPKSNPQLYISFLHYIAYTADVEILNFIGDMPFETTGFGDRVVGFAPRLTRQQIREIFFLRDKEPIDQLYQGAELQYSVNRCTNEERKLIRLYQEKALSMRGHLARLGKKLKSNGLGYTMEFIFKRVVRKALIKMKVLPDL